MKGMPSFVQIACLLLFIFVQLAGRAQRIEVRSSEDGRPLPYAHVVFKPAESSRGESYTVVTDGKGSAICPADGRVFLHISYTGFASVTDTLSGEEELSVYYLRPQAVDMEPLVVTAQYRPGSPEKSMVPLAVLTRKDIDSRAAVNLEDLLRDQMNIRISRDNVLGASLSVNGMSGQNVKILIDGIPLIGRLNGNLDPGQINLNEIERVEVIKGPLSIEYGSNALAGTINLITKKPGKKPSAFVHLYGEAGFHYNIDGGAGFGLGKNNLQLHSGRNFFAGWSADPDSRKKTWNPKEQYFGSLQWQRSLAGAEIRFRSAWFRELILDRGAPLAPYFETAFDHYYRTKRFDNSIHLRKSGKVYGLEVQGAYNVYSRVRNRYFKDLVSLNETLTRTPGDQDSSRFDRYMLRAVYRHVKDEAPWQFELGSDLNLETGRGSRLAGGRQSIGDYALFASARWSPRSFLAVKPGLRQALNTRYPTPLLPGISLRWRLSEKLILRMAYARGFRAPSLKELNLEFVDVNHDIRGNPALKAEKSNNYNIALSYKKALQHSVIRSEWTAYYIDFFNRIVLSSLGGSSYSYENSGAMRFMGSNVSLAYRTENLQLRAGGGLEYQRPDLEGDTLPPFTPSPEFTLNGQFHEAHSGLDLQFYYKYTGRRLYFLRDENRELRSDYLAGYHMADISISRSFVNDRVRLQAGIKNLFDLCDVEARIATAVHGAAGGRQAVGYGRSFFLNLKINW